MSAMWWGRGKYGTLSSQMYHFTGCERLDDIDIELNKLTGKAFYNLDSYIVSKDTNSPWLFCIAESWQSCVWRQVIIKTVDTTR